MNALGFDTSQQRGCPGHKKRGASKKELPMRIFHDGMNMHSKAMYDPQSVWDEGHKERNKKAHMDEGNTMSCGSVVAARCTASRSDLVLHRQQSSCCHMSVLGWARPASQAKRWETRGAGTAHRYGTCNM